MWIDGKLHESYCSQQIFQTSCPHIENACLPNWVLVWETTVDLVVDEHSWRRWKSMTQNMTRLFRHWDHWWKCCAWSLQFGIGTWFRIKLVAFKSTSTTMSSVLWQCWFGGRKCIRSVRNWVMRCWRHYLVGVKCNWFAWSGPADAFAIHHLLLHWNVNGSAFLVPAYPGCPGKQAVKRVYIIVGR